MITIPKQLQNKDFRFIKIKYKDKIPVEKNWQNINNYTYDNINLIKWLKQNNNYGIICGYGDLIVIDCDNQKLFEILDKKFPQTFTIETGTGGRHYYYIVKEPLNTITLENADKHFGEIRGKNSQVICPNSIHPNGNVYKILYDVDIKYLHKNTVMENLKQYIKKAYKPTIIKKYDNDNYANISITKIININEMKQIGVEYVGKHPVHDSTGGRNFCVNVDKNLWHCFRHNTGGGVITLIALLHGLINCKDCITGCVTPEIFKQVVEIAKNKYNIKIGDEKI